MNVTDQRSADVHIRKSEPENLTRAHGLDLKLLQPWRGVDAPFRGAWCVLRPGDASEPHAHHEHEIFIGMAGRAQVASGGQRHEFVAGDIVFVRPGVEHRVINEHDEDFSYYAIWWDRAMSLEFFTRADGQGRPEPAEASRTP
jgi:mannose-6-phosphate isomerase-like protein (cupin superfamily)